MHCIYTVFSGTKRNEVLIPHTTGMTLETVMLREGGQSQKTKYCINPLKGRVHGRQMMANEYTVSFRGDKNVLKLDCGNGCTKQ